MTHTTPTEAREVADRLEAKKLDVSTWVAVTALRSLADQLEAVTAERDAYKLDAERYRRLRECCAQPDFPTDILLKLVTSSKTLDSLIHDEATAKEKTP